mmetsp:Transcript_5061/g.10262  ORF Transcript_5061/g.10262 Transcript_5061/m.10262 type:complete len:205 (+) Transcript_5061:1864-2478(+)
MIGARIYSSLLILSGTGSRDSRGSDAKDNLFRVFLLYSDMRSSGIEPDRVVYNTLIDACALAGDSDRAFQVFASMQVGQVRPDVVTYTSLMKACIAQRNMTRAMQVFDAMKIGGCSPSAITFCTLIDGACKGQNLELAVALLREFIDGDLTVTREIFDTVVLECCRQNARSQLEKSLQLAEQCQVALGRRTKMMAMKLIRGSAG